MPIQLAVREGDVLGGLSAQEGESRHMPLLRSSPPEDVSEGPRFLPELARPTAGRGVCEFFHGFSQDPSKSGELSIPWKCNGKIQ
jgi:hypothetical protein